MKACLIFILLALASIAAAQDQIFKKDNTKVDAKVLEINQAEIRYKLFTYQDGPTITISKSDVAMIIYQNGSHEVFNTPAPADNTPAIGYTGYDRLSYLKEREAEDKRQRALFDTLTTTRQVIFLNVLDIFNGSAGLSYLREFAHNKLSVYVPVSAGFTYPWTSNTFNIISENYSNLRNFKYTHKTIDAALGLNYQVSNKRAVTYFAGPMVGVAQFNGSYDQEIKLPYGNYYYQYKYETRTFVVNNYYYLVNNGFLFRITPNFNLMINAAMGYQHQDFVSGHPRDPYTSYTPAFPVNCIKIGFHLGYRF